MYGIVPSYRDVWDRRRWSSDKSLVQTLQLLGAAIDRPDQAGDALRARRLELWRTMAEPSVVAWEGRRGSLDLRMEAGSATGAYLARLEFEDGGRERIEGRLEDLASRRERRVEGTPFVAKRLPLPDRLPRGYHRCTIELADRQAETTVIAAPQHAYGEPPGNRQLLWGVFLPLYALYRETSWGAGDFSDLESLMQWTADQGGSLVATLPQLSSLWELSDDPSPYSPASRLAFNEFYLDLRRLPELQACPEAQEMLSAVDRDVARGNSAGGGLVDYPAQMTLKRRILQRLSHAFFSQPPDRRSDFERFRQEHAELDLYARFRAVGERFGKPWTQWPEPQRSGNLRPEDYDQPTYELHAYSQWRLEQQLRTMADDAQQREMLWYLDFPLGVSGAGFDVWRDPDVFVQQAAGGAPPDAFFTKGQNWGFPPLHPDRLRQQGYRYLIASLRRHLEYARVLRFDHVMSLYRLYWVPDGLPADQGAYVRYPAEELFAVLTLESHRSGARIVGENLGTVPDVVNESMERHGIDEMYVLQYETAPNKRPVMRPVPRRCVASMNTHDTPQFAAWWTGLDIDDRMELGLLDEEEARLERNRRALLRDRMMALLQERGRLERPTRDPQCVLEACLAHLGASRAPIVLVNLEDLWLETEPQNRPGTYREYPNWQRRARYSFEQFTQLPGVLRTLATLDRCRRAAENSKRQEESRSRDGLPEM